MKNLIKLSAILLLAVLPQYGSAQLYAGSGGNVYVKGEVLFVQQGVELTANANVYLRNEGQLVQGTTALSFNKGAGKLSLYQEGRATQYTYNYWCSPVGNASATTGNENFGISMLGRPINNTTSTPANVNIADSDGVANPLIIANGWIFKYLSSDSPTAWIPVGNTSTIAAGQGFTMKGTAGNDATAVEGNGVQNNPGSAQRYEFSGKPNDGNISVAVAASKYTLSGNPYPSALHLNAFMLDPSNTASTGTAYFWEQNMAVQSHYLIDYRGGYGTYSPVSVASQGIYVPATFNTYNSDGTLNTTGTSSNLNIARKYSPIGQGFMLQGAANGTVTLKNSHRVYYKEGTTPQSFFNRPVIEQSDNIDSIRPLPLLRFNIAVNSTSTRQLALAFPDESTIGADYGIDARMIKVGMWPNDIFFALGGDNYVIQGLPFEISAHIPLNIFAASQGEFIFSIAEALHFPESQPVFIYDGLTDSYHDITNSTFEIALESGVYSGRFEIRFIDQSLGTDTGQTNRLDFDIVHNNVEKRLVISNPGKFEDLDVGFFDSSGRRVFAGKESGISEEYRYSTAGYSDGVYVVRVVSKGRAPFSQKFVIKGN